MAVQRNAAGKAILLGYLHINGWAGASATQVLVVGETPKRIRIRALTRTRLAGVGRWLDVGSEALVPRSAVTISGGPNEVDAIERPKAGDR